LTQLWDFSSGFSAVSLPKMKQRFSRNFYKEKKKALQMTNKQEPLFKRYDIRNNEHDKLENRAVILALDLLIKKQLKGENLCHNGKPEN